MTYQLVETFFPFIPFVHGYRIVRYSKSMASLKSPFITHQLSCIRQRFETIYQLYVQSGYGYVPLEKITLHLSRFPLPPIDSLVIIEMGRYKGMKKKVFNVYPDGRIQVLGRTGLLTYYRSQYSYIARKSSIKKAFCPRRIELVL